MNRIQKKAGLTIGFAMTVIGIIIYYLIWGRLDNDTMDTILGSVLAGLFYLILQTLLTLRAEKDKIENTKSTLELEFRRIYKTLLHNIEVYALIKRINDTELKKDNNTTVGDFAQYSTINSLAIKTVVMDSLVSTGAILQLEPNEINNIQIIDGQLSDYSSGVEWFSHHLLGSNIEDINKALKQIKKETDRTIECLEYRLDFKWFDFDKMKKEVTKELKCNQNQCF